MKNIFSILSVFFLMAVTAQTPDQIVEQYIKALGGEQNLSSIKSIQKIDTMSANGMDFPMKTYQDLTGKILSTMQMGGQEIILVAFDGQKGFMFDQATFGYKDIPDSLKTDYADKAKNFFGYFYKYKEKGYQLKYKGKKIMDGKEMEAIDLHMQKPAEGGIQDFVAYFDVKDHLLKIIEINKNNMTIFTKIDQYKKFGDVNFPTLVVTEVNGAPAMTLKTAEVSINVPAPSKEMFQKPGN